MMKRETDLRKLINQVVPSHVEQALFNWARWAGTGRGGGSSYSIESRYRRRGEDSDSGRIPIDESDAAKMESIMRFLPDKDRGLLVGHYVYHIGWQPLCRVLALPISHDSFSTSLRRAALMAWNRYECVRR